MAARWKNISSAPQDGSVIEVRRRLDGRIVFQGLACWRRFTAPPLIDPFTGNQIATAADELAWMYPMGHSQELYKVPSPTEWRERA